MEINLLFPRYIVKEIYGCHECDYFCDEGEFCRHPTRKGSPHVVNMYKDGKLDPTFTFPDDCPLPLTTD